MKFYFGVFLVFLIGCQKEAMLFKEDQKLSKNLDSQLLEDKTFSCDLKYTTPDENLIKKEPLSLQEHNYAVVETEEIVKEALESAPQIIFDQWKGVGGNVIVTEKFYEKCQFSIFSCIELGEKEQVHIIVPYLKKEQTELLKPLFQRAILNSIATLHIEKLEDFEENQKETLNENEDEKYVFGPYRLDVLLFLADEIARVFHKETIIESGFDIYPLVFAEYFCSENSRKLLSQDLPDVSNLFLESFGSSPASLQLNRVSSVSSRTSSDSSSSSISRDSIDRKVDIKISPDSLRSDIAKKSEEIEVLNDEIFSSRDTERQKSLILEEILARESLEASVDSLKSYEDLYYQGSKNPEGDSIRYVAAEVGVKKSFKIGSFPLFHYTEKKGLESYNGPGRIIYSQSLNIKASAGRLNQKKPITIIVHGTGYGGGNVATDVYKNALSENPVRSTRGWANPDSSIAKNLQKHYGGDVVSFQWSGNFTDKYRRESGTKLSQEIVRLRNKGFEVNIVAHSHGANIAIDALNKTKSLSGDQNFSTKGEFIALGRPVRNDYKLSDIKLLSYYVNAFGSRDFIQTIGGELPKKFGKKIDDLAQTQIDFGNNIFIHNKLMNAMNNVLIHSANDRGEFASEVYSY